MACDFLRSGACGLAGCCGRWGIVGLFLYDLTKIRCLDNVDFIDVEKIGRL